MKNHHFRRSLFLLLCLAFVDVVCFAQTERYSFKDYSKESENHACLDNILFKADSVVFYEYDSIENRYSFTLHIKLINIGGKYPPNDRVEAPDKFILDVYLDPAAGETFYKEVEATYDTIAKTKDLRNIFPFPSYPIVEVPNVGFIKTESSLVAYKLAVNTVPIIKVGILYRKKLFVIREKHCCRGDGLVRYASCFIFNEIPGFCFSEDGKKQIIIKWEDVLSRKQYLKYLSSQVKDTKTAVAFLQKMGLRWNIFGIYLSPKFS